MHTLRVLLTSLCCATLLLLLGAICALLVRLDHTLQRRTDTLERATTPLALPAPRAAADDTPATVHQ